VTNPITIKYTRLTKNYKLILKYDELYENCDIKAGKTVTVY